MSGQEAVYQWMTEVGERLPGLEPGQARARATLSYGMVLARSCALTAVSGLLAVLLGKRPNTMRRYLRESVYEASAKRGHGRREVEVRACFAPLLGWVRSLWEGRQLALVLDATSLGDRLVVLAVSVLYRGGAIPVSWTVLPAGEPHAWRREWLRMLRELRPAVPRHCLVIVLADRGLYAGWLFRRISRLPWHPLLRVNLGGTFRPAGCHTFHPLRTFAPTSGTAWQGTAIAPPSHRHRTAIAPPSHRHRLQDHGVPASLHAAGALGGRSHRPLAAAHRPGARSGGGWLVWPARLDRAGFQADQTRRLPVAAHPHDRPRPRRTALAGGGARHALAAERRR